MIRSDNFNLGFMNIEQHEPYEKVMQRSDTRQVEECYPLEYMIKWQNVIKGSGAKAYRLRTAGDNHDD
jgi:hypothetical protein